MTITAADAPKEQPPSPATKALLEAYSSGDQVAFKAALDNGADPNVKYSSEQTLLSAVLCQEPSFYAHALLDAGADPKHPNQTACVTSLLYDAVRYSDQELITRLVEKGADLEAGTRLEKTPLMGAILYGREDIADYLIKNGANVNAEDNLKYTPLFYAALYRQESIALKLIREYKARTDVLNIRNETILHASASSGCESLVRLLLDGKSAADPLAASGETPLILAAKSKDETAAIIALLLAKGANIEHKENNGDRALHAASLSKNLPAINLLLDKGADINSQGNQKTTPLMYAVRNENIIALLLAKGAKIDMQDDKGRTALHAAAAIGHAGTVKMLLTAGALITEIDPKNVKNGKVVRLLLDHGIPTSDFDFQNLPPAAKNVIRTWEDRTNSKIAAKDSIAAAIKNGNAAKIIPSFIDSQTGRLNIETMESICDLANNNVLEMLGARGELRLIFKPEYWKDAPEEAEKLRQKIPPVYRDQTSTSRIYSALNLKQLDILCPPRRRPHL